MSVDRVLSRVEADLARGHTHVAIQRLTTLVQQNPERPELRERLAAVHLMTGNLVEAGRWSYFSDDADLDAVAAFERAFPHPSARFDALRVRVSVYALVRNDGIGRDRYEGLRVDMAAASSRSRLRGTPLTREERSSLGGRAWAIAYLAAVVLLITTFAVGVVTIVGAML